MGETHELEALFETALELLCVAGTDGYFKRVNPAFTATLGWSREELLAKPFIDFVHPEDVQNTLAEGDKLAKGVPTISFENRYRCRDGQYKWLLWNSRPVGSSLYAAARDITATKKHQNELEELDQLFQLSLELLCIAGTDGYFKRVNPAFTQALGWSSGELLARPFLDFVHPEDIPSTLLEMEKLAAGAPTITFENRYLCKNGEYKWLLWNSRPSGSTLYAAANDITRRKESEARLEKRTRDLEQARETLERQNVALLASHRRFVDVATGRTHRQLEDKRVLMADHDRRQLQVAEIALRGTGINLDAAWDIARVRRYLGDGKYDLFLATEEFLPLAAQAHEQRPDMPIVFVTDKKARSFIPVLKQHPFLSNIVSRQAGDRILNLKNITVTVVKLLAANPFGLEKYLNWGVDIQHLPITGSETRPKLLDELQGYLQKLGCREFLIHRAVAIADELTMNAVYDAPVDDRGRPKYNHLPRGKKIRLLDREQGRLSFASDGMLIAISVEDPFGALSRDVIIEYLERCYDVLPPEGETAGDRDPPTTAQPNKVGGGMGLYQIMARTALFAVSVDPGIKTEAVALLNLDPEHRNSNANGSFHFFSRR